MSATRGYPNSFSHMDVSPGCGNGISEKEIVYLADKMLWGEKRVSVEARFSSRLESVISDKEVLDAITTRLENAISIRRRVEVLVGCSLSEMLSDTE